MPRYASNVREIALQGFPRLVLFSAFWWVLTDGDSGAWIVGGVTVIAATAISLVLVPQVRWRLRLGGLARFLLFFFRNSLQGGIDVAWRALHPRLPLKPLLHDYPLRLPPGSARILFVDCVSLLPGTLSATLQDEKHVVTVHILAENAAVIETMQALESAVGDVFGIALPPASRPGEQPAR